MQGPTLAKVKGLPLHLSSAALHELCNHYGAIRIRTLSGPMKGTVVVEFPSEDAAMRGVAALSGLRLWDRTLSATLLPANTATATTSAAPSPSSSTPSPPPHLPPFGHPIHHSFTTNAAMPAGPMLQHHALSLGVAPMPSRAAADPASALGKRPLLADASYEAQPNGVTTSSAFANANAELGPEYLYPPLDVDIVANIVRALAEVPQFYTQTLHLMNKLHLPAPFGPQKHTAASTRARAARHLGPQPKRRKKVVTARNDDDLSTDESELESDAEEDTMQEQIGLISSAVHAFQKVPTPALPTSKKHDTIQIKLGGAAVVSGTTTTLPSGALSTSAEVAAATPPTPSTSTGTTTEPTEPMAVECALVRPLTSEELAANRMPVSQLLQTKGYDKYQPGTPSHKLHLKNLHRKKEVSPSELRRLFGSFVAPGQNPNDIEIKVMTGRMSGQAFVTLASQELATQALGAVHGYVLHGLPVFVEYGREAKGKPANANPTAE